MPGGAGVRDRILDLVRRNVVRAGKYSLSGFIGFLVIEGITGSLVAELGTGMLVPIDVLAYFTGIATEFLINEHWTTLHSGLHTGRLRGKLVRMMKFEALNVLGNSVSIGTQLALFRFFHLDPLIGNFIGSFFSFPVNYYFQMRVVWGGIDVTRE